MAASLLNLATLIPPLISSTKLEKPHLPLLAALSLILVAIYFFRTKKVYLLDFSCYCPPDSTRCPLSSFIEHTVISEASFTEEAREFQIKVLERSGLGNETCVPPGIQELPPDLSMKTSRIEVENILFSVVEDILDKYNINPKSIDILVTNCSIFCPTPSLCALIINKFGMRSNILSYHLAGMGCGAGILAVNLVRDLLKVHKNSLALVLSMEAITPNGYPGKEKSMLLTNCLFRMGGAAILLSNRNQDKKIAKYVLQHLVCTHRGSIDKAYSCIFQENDSEGTAGVSLSRGVVKVAKDALIANISSLGPLVLPYSEQLRFGLSIIQQKVWIFGGKTGLCVPDFKKAFEHFCIHAGGRAVIETMEKSLGLTEENVEASKMTLYRFGNTSSSSIWYELCYLEAKGRIKKGDRVWQIALGSGFKCNSAVWKCVSELKCEGKNAWSDRIHSYPVDVPDVVDH